MARKVKNILVVLVMIFSINTLSSCIDPDVKKSHKVAKQRTKAKKSHSTRHRNHKKLAH